MNKSLSTLLLAGLVAVGTVAQAQTFNSPTRAGEASTMTMGAPNRLTTNSPHGDHSMVVGTTVVDTTVMGAPAAVMRSGTGGPDTVVTYVHRPDMVSRTHAAATFDVPARAGEASTMTGGAPNMVTNNHDFVLQNRHPVVMH